ncbi:MAG: hypothetical protein AB3N14_20785 [Flavobacteriaceae bacterium]
MFPGCETTEQDPVEQIAIRAILDPETSLTRESKIFIDPYRDTEIKYRTAMGAAISVAESMGLNLSSSEEAEFAMFLNFRKGLTYDLRNDRFIRTTTVVRRRSSITVGEDEHIHYGVINAGVFSLSDTAVRTQWEGSVEVLDINNEADVRASLMELFKKFPEGFIGRVDLVLEDLGQQVAGGDATR